MMAWLSANWMETLVLLMAVDSYVLTIWPGNTVAVAIKNMLSGVIPKQ
jgi:hypothetical protein